MGFGVDPPSKPSIYAFHKQFFEAGCVKGKFPLLRVVWMELEYQLDVYRVTSSAYVEHF
jgi:hypothetical protein